MGKVTAEEMQGLMYGNSNNTARSDGSSPKKVSASDMENLMAPYRSQEIKHTVLSPGTQPAQAAPAGASSRKKSETMKQNVDTLKKQRDDALIKAGAYSRAGNMQQQAKEQRNIASELGYQYENARSAYKTQKNMEELEGYNPNDNHFKAGDMALAGIQNAFQSFGQNAATMAAYANGPGREEAWNAKRLIDSGMNGLEAQKLAGIETERKVPILDYKTKAEIRHERNVESTHGLERLGLQLGNTIFNMAPSLALNLVAPGSQAGLIFMSSSAAGNKFVEATEKYDDPNMAFALAMGAGLAAYGSEQLGGIYGKAWDSKVGQALQKKLVTENPALYALANSVGGKWLRDSMSEGVEEGLEDAVNYAIEKSLTGESDEMDNIGYDMLLGALAGGVMGGANAATRAVNYNRLGKTLKKSPAAVQQQIEEGLSKGEGTAPAIYAAEAQKKPTPQMLGRLFEANQSFDAESGLSKIQGDITQLSIRELKAMMNNANAIVQAAETLGVKPTPESVMTEVFSKQKEAAVKTAQDGVGQAFAQMVDNPANAGEVAYNSAIQGAPANQSAAQKVYNDPAARESFAKLAGIEYTGNPAADIAAIEVATKKLGETGKQVVSEAEYTERMTEAAERATAELEAKAEAEADVLEQESLERWLSIEQNTDIDIDGKRHVREITNTDVRGNSEISYKKAEIPNSKKPAVNAVEGAAKYLGKTIVWFEGAVQVNGQYRLTNGYRAPDGTIYVNINSRDPLMVTFGHEMFHDLVADSKYSGLIDTLVENPDYADMVNGMMNAKTELYERNGIELDPNAAAEEVAADISGDLLGSRDMLEYIGARNTEAATGIKGFLNRILKKLKGKPSAQEAYNRLSESQKALLDGLEGRTGSSSSGTKYSIIDIVGENGKNYGKGVRLDSELLTGLTDAERIQMVKDYVKELGGSTFTAYDQNGNEVTVSIAKASNKFRNKNGKRVPVNKDLALKNGKSHTKQEAIALIDELITTSRYDGKRQPNYPHGWLDNNGKNEWEYWTTYLQDKNNTVFEATLNIAATKGGEKILYDISPIKMVGRSVESDALPTTDMIPQSDTAVNTHSMQNIKEDAGDSYSLMDIPAMDSEYSAAVESGNMQEAQRLVDEAAKENGYTIKAFHGTSRGDRVGNVFLPERATSGPMAFFTDNREVAERYSRDKADTSLAYDPDFDQYETQFRIKAGKLDVPLIKAWGYLPFDARNRITKKAGQVRMDMDTGDIIVDQSTNEANGGFQGQIKEFKGNTLAALNEQWLNSGTLFNEEGTYLDVLKAAGVFDEFAKVKGMGEPYFKDPKYREEKVYDVFLGIRNPFDIVQDVNNEFIDAFEEWYTEQDQSIYDRETADADMWDKNSVTAEEFAERMREDVANGTTMSWTSIPDSMTDYLKSLGYDGIKDVGGKYSGSYHTVWIPFSSEQVKSAEPIVRDDAGNVIPLSERFNNSNSDIRYSLMEDAQYMADIDKAVSEATQKADDELKAAQAQVKDLRKQILEMRNRAEYAELQTRVTEKPTVDPIKAKRDIGRFLRKNGITNDETIKTLTAEIEDAFNSVYRWEKTDIDSAAKKVAATILKEGTIADPLKAEKADIRKSLSQRTFVIGEQLRGDIVHKYGSLTNFRKKYGNIIRIKTRENANAGEGVAFDVAYSELQSEFPGIFRDAETEWETFENTVEVADYAKDSERIPLSYAVDEEEFARSITNQLTDLLWSQKELVTEADKAKAKADAATEKAVDAAVEAERQRGQKETAANDRWRDAETKLLTEIAAAKEREKAAKARAEFMAKYDALAKQYRADLRANNRQMRDKYNEKLSEAKDEYNRKRQQDRIDRVVQEDRAKSKARLRTAEQKSTTTEDVAKVLTEMPNKGKETFKAKIAESWRTFKRQWINTKDELERFGNEVGDRRIMYAANNVGQASAAAQYSIGGAGQYDLNGAKISDKNLMQVFEPAEKAGLTKEFYTYLLHEHNVDRMSVREKAQKVLSAFREELNKKVKGFAEMTDENIATAAGKDASLTKTYTMEQIDAAKRYKQLQAWAEKQFDKPVFGSKVTADDSRAAAAALLEAHPEFEKWAKDVYAYLDGLMEVRKQGGLVSADMAQYMKELYPHYVPTYRDMPSTSGGYSNPNIVAVNSTIKSAKGGNQDIMPLIDSIARQTLQTFSAAKKNILGNMLYEDAMDTTRDISEYIQSVTEEGDLVDLDADSAENLKNTLRIWVDGKPVTLHMSEAMADGFRPIEQSNSFGMKALRSINSTFKKLVTQWNPVFIVRNFVRDAQSALYFTHYSNAAFIKNYGKAVKEIATNGKYWQLYQAMGGKGTTYYDPKAGLSDRHHFKNGAVDKVAGGLNRVIDILSFANEAVEQYPRLAEFISTMEDTGDVQQALYNAADITTNFGRGGFAARKLNASLVPFFNPGMQGLSKNIRNVIDRRGWKEIGQLISRLLINGVAPAIIMGLLYDGLKEDDDYKELSNYMKDSNILIKVGDNKFIKIPMGREPSVITAFTNRMWRWLKGEPASSAFANYPSFAIEQIAPNNPLTNNIFAGITAMSTNKTWYGGDIVSSYMEEKPDYLQYDESTDAFSIWLGEITRHGKNGIEGLSPKKVNYLIDQYSGFIGDWVLPALSKKADVPAVVKAFVVDSVRQNRLGSDFYDALDEAKQVKETEFATAADDATFSYLYKQSKAASEITKQLKEIYNSGEKTRKEKMSEARDLLELRNEIYRKALLTVGTYEETAKNIGSADSDVVKREANRKAFGAEYALKTYNKDVGEKAAEYVAQGVTYDQYYAAYFAARGITGDKDGDGKTIQLSSSRKKKAAIDKAVPGASTKQKHLLYEALGVSDKVW